ncbi:hypothetical protein B0H13DRAFT_1877858 [Mycena leptocephala]|nr:hypothetical protein B0H13DRAFT_1877858 [Mycena leptocephala]
MSVAARFNQLGALAGINGDGLRCRIPHRRDGFLLLVTGRERLAESSLGVFYLFSVVLAQILAANAAPGVQPAPNVGTVFAVYPRWDMDNGGNSTSGGTEIGLAEVVRRSPSCVAYAYVPHGGGGGPPGTSCFLKNTVDITTFKTRAWDTTVGLVGACGTFTPASPSSCFTRVIGAARTNTGRTGIYA